MCAKSDISAKSPRLMCRLPSPLPIGPSLSSCSPAACSALRKNVRTKRTMRTKSPRHPFAHQDDQAVHLIVLPGGWRQCTGKTLRCRAKQDRREDGADVWILTSIVVRFLGGFENGRNSLV